MSTPVANLPVILAKRELALERRRRELARENAIHFFAPHEKQMDFYKAAEYHYRYARTGNRFGKSELGGCEDVAFALGYRPWMEQRFEVCNGRGEIVYVHEGHKGHPLTTLGLPKHPTKGIVVTADWDKSKEVFTEQEGENLGKLFKYIPKSALGQPTRNHSGAIDRIPVRHVSGGWSVIHLDTVKSYKQNPLGQESSSWDWIHVDEPIPEGMWHALARGLIDRDGRAWFTCTPLTEPWIDTLFIPDLEDLSAVRAASTHGDFWMMTGTTDDNPHNSADAINRVMQQFSEEERETRRSGIPRAYSGLVYKEFRWETHVLREPPVGWKDWTTPPSDHSLRFAIDYHPRKPHHVLFIATSPQERQFVYAEIFLSCLMAELVTEIRAVLRSEPTVPGLIDPLASTPNRVTDLSPLEEVQRLGLPVVPATKDPYNGILKVKEELTKRDRNGLPMMVVNPACRRFLFEISRGYIWDGETNKPVKQNDDAMENFYRLCLQGLSYIEPATSADYSPISLPDIPDNVLDFENQRISFPWEEAEPKKKLYATRYRA